MAFMMLARNSIAGLKAGIRKVDLECSKLYVSSHHHHHDPIRYFRELIVHVLGAGVRRNRSNGRQSRPFQVGNPRPLEDTQSRICPPLTMIRQIRSEIYG